MKFELHHPTESDFCTQCGEQIDKIYVRLEQNRWAKPKLCIKCMKDFIDIIEGREIKERERKEIVYQTESLSKNGWMG